VKLEEKINNGRGEVSAIINSVAVPPCSCLVQAVIGAVALDIIGLPDIRIGLGGLIYRCGPSAKDLMCYCNPEGYGFHDTKSNILFGHAFILQGSSTLIDLSLSDLKHDLDYLIENGGTEARNINWQTSPAPFYWGPAETIRQRGRPRRFPKPGEAVITDYISQTPPLDVLKPYEHLFISHALDQLAPQIVELRLRYEAGDLLL
jgi:hypothetical protein